MAPSIVEPQVISNGNNAVSADAKAHSSAATADPARPAGEANALNNHAAHNPDQKKDPGHATGHKSVLQSDTLYQYILQTSVYPRESPYQTELREITAKHPWNLMVTPPDEGQFLMLLMKLINAKNTLELGVYTGYSLLSTALALPEDGKEKYLGFFDFVFVDADKDNYLNYHERLLKLVKVGGVIGYDNTLWSGSLVAPEDVPYRKYIRHYRPFVLELNRVLAADERIEISQIPVGDGITLCRRVK